MTDLSVLEQCLLTCDAPESVWRPALEGMTSQIDDLKTAGRNARDDATAALDLVSRIRMALNDNGKRMQDELLEWCRDLAMLPHKMEMLQVDLDRYMAMVSPANAIDLGEFLGPTKPCPFCGSIALERDGFEEHIVCKNCGASAPVSGWQFRAPIN